MNQVKKPLSIAGLGMVSCLGVGAEANASAMRCGYDGFQQTSFNQPYSTEKQLGASIEIEEDQYKNLRGIPKLSYLCQLAIKEATTSLDAHYEGLQVHFCLPERSLPHYLSSEYSHRELLNKTREYLTFGKFDRYSQAHCQQRCSFVNALQQAQQSLYDKSIPYVLIVGIDSLLNSATLNYYGGGLYGEDRRLLGEDHSNGFIPGEAVTAVLLCKADAGLPVVISGIGSGEEIATWDNDDEVLKGHGLANAIKQASQQAGVEIHDTGFRVSSVSGEAYFFKEAALAQIKTLKKKVPDQPLWHPADCVGEIGAAIGGAMIIMTYYAFIKGYALGRNALCQISNDNAQRGAFIVQYNQ